MPERIRLEPVDPAQVWRAIRPALAEGRCPELVKQLVAVFADPVPMRPGYGWYHPSRCRYGWDWLADRFDAERDGAIGPDEFDAPDRPEAWQALDRDGDGRLTPTDLDWPAPEKDWSRYRYTFRYRWNRAKAILNGDLGSMFEGPDLDAPAPDFTLPAQDGSGERTLSHSRGEKPVVLIFGSFT